MGTQPVSGAPPGISCSEDLVFSLLSHTATASSNFLQLNTKNKNRVTLIEGLVYMAPNIGCFLT